MAVIALPMSDSPSPTCPILPDAALTVTPSDANTFAGPVAIYVGGAGNVTVTPANGNTDVVVVANAGTIIPFRVLAVKATGTTATSMLAIY